MNHSKTCCWYKFKGKQCKNIACIMQVYNSRYPLIAMYFRPRQYYIRLLVSFCPSGVRPTLLSVVNYCSIIIIWRWSDKQTVCRKKQSVISACFTAIYISIYIWTLHRELQSKRTTRRHDNRNDNNAYNWNIILKSRRLRLFIWNNGRKF